MPNSLNAGPQLKKSRSARIWELIQGANAYIRSGATFRVNTGGVLVADGPTAVVRLVPGTKPATCTVGDLCADSADGNKLYQCTATNTWTKVGTQV